MVVRRRNCLVVKRKERQERVVKKAMKCSQKGGFSHNQKKAQARISSSPKAEEAREALILHLDFQPRKHPVKKDFAVLGSQTTGAKWGTERDCCVVEVEDLVVNIVPSEWVLFEGFNNPNDE